MIVSRKNRNPRIARWFNARPGRVIAISFFLVILIGTALLALPIASKDETGIGLLRALFTATSATCVTGLVVVDTATHWTLFGKIVIITLIQIGGLGLVTITSFFYSFMKRKFSLKTLVVTQESTASFGFADIFRLVRKIILITLAVEIIGGIIISWRFIPRYGWWPGIGKGFFHAVSSFCNAGFDLLGDSRGGPYTSLMHWNDDPLVILTTACLIVIGGLGFVVWSDLLNYKKAAHLNFHTRVVLSMTALLLLSGTLFFLLAESANTASGALGALPEAQKPLAALFQSVTCRTAGFNSIDQASLNDSSKLVSIFLMFIGAAPGSTAGGIKVSTLAVILATVFSDVRGQEDIVLMRHRLSRETFTRAIAILGLAVSVVALTSLALSFIENRALSQPGGFEFLDLAFESASAFGTVGLTSAGTPGLQPASWAVLIPAMFLGRVGPASFAISLMMARQHKREMVYPEGKTLVG